MENNKPRTKSYAQSWKLSIVDRFGIYLSERIIMRCFKNFRKNDIAVLDLGCGYHARILRKLSPLISRGVGVDVAVHQDAKSVDNLTLHEDSIENALLKFNANFFDFILMISVLEHLDDPLSVLKECRRVLKNEGVLLINVPTWRGKAFLEFSAFNLNLSPRFEIDDHKMYYDKKDLWPILIKAGFKPSAIKMKYYKFGLNLYAVCKNKI